MKILILSGSPNKVGLTMSCVTECENGLKDLNCEVEHICLNHYKIERCEACGERGWGNCLNKHICRIEDDFNDLYDRMQDYDAYVLITPVYFHEMSEVFKTFFDRLKRCDAFNPNSKIKGKNVVFIAAAGGSGSGTEQTLNSMDTLGYFLKLNIKDRIDITRNNFEPKKENIKKAMQSILN